MSDKAKGWVYVLVQFLLFFIIIYSVRLESKYGLGDHSKAAAYAGLIIAITGALLLIASFINFGQRITANPVPLERYKLKTTGLYAIVRHPIYFSLLVMFIGIVIHLNAYVSLFWIVILFLFFVKKSKMEEEFLLQKFPEYREYQSKTKRLIPFIF
jgi:protein-S-isoprenylcysteine O-methyltransferase Ste14